MEITYSRSSVGYLLGEVQLWVRLRYVAFCAYVYMGMPSLDEQPAYAGLF